ncbi:uncharacterized protein UDID_19272 [Ustilago sp. UG-2017a]|nr:uncharacterized protein UDID_19272 [Ustilago sp. UG-2017a]
MVRYSDKQALLNDIVHTLELSIPAEIKQNTDRVQHSCSTDIDNLEDDGDPLLLSQHLVHLYTFICKQRYTITCYNPLGRTNKLIHLLNRLSSGTTAAQVIGSIVGYTNHTVTGLLELNNNIMQFALEGERQHAAAWVHNTTGVEEWGKGWLVVDGTHIPLAWKPGVLIVGQPGSVQDLKVWASGSNILKKPHLYLDEGEFIWVDGGYGHSAITVRPFSHIAADKSYCSNIYHVKDRITTAETIQACIVAHTFASQYDCPADIADLLLPSFSEDEVSEVVQSLQLDARNVPGTVQIHWHNEEDTTALSQCHEKTTVDYNAMTQSTSARRREQALTQLFSI